MPVCLEWNGWARQGRVKSKFREIEGARLPNLIDCCEDLGFYSE